MANKYLVGSANWDSATAWRTASGGATITTPPTSADAAILDGNSGDLDINVNSACSSFAPTSAYTGTVTGTASLTCSGSFTIGANCVWSYTGALTIGVGTTTGTINLNGNNIWGAFTWGGTGAKTLASNIPIYGLYGFSATSTITGLAYNIYTYGGLNAPNYYMTYNVNNPTTYLRGGTSTGYISGRLTLLDGNVKFSENNTAYSNQIRDNATLRYLSGTIDTTNSIMRIINGATFDCDNNVVWNRIEWASGTITNTTPMYVQNDFLSVSVSGAVVGTVYCGGNIRFFGNTTISSGDFIMTGTGTFALPVSYNSITNDGTVLFSGNLTINTSGTITFQPKKLTFSGVGKSLTYISGGIVSTGVTFAPVSEYTFDIEGFTIPVFSIETTVSNSNIYILSNCTLSTIKGVTGSSLMISSGKTVNSSNIYYYGNETDTTRIGGNGATAYLNYSGGYSNLRLINIYLLNLNASGSNQPIFTWQGSTSNSVNCFAVTPRDIGGGQSAIQII